MEETREALVQKLLDIYSKEGNYETSVPGVWVHRSERKIGRASCRERVYQLV